jgi:hypothetical protein
VVAEDRAAVPVPGRRGAQDDAGEPAVRPDLGGRVGVERPGGDAAPGGRVGAVPDGPAAGEVEPPPGRGREPPLGGPGPGAGRGPGPAAPAGEPAAPPGGGDLEADERGPVAGVGRVGEVGGVVVEPVGERQPGGVVPRPVADRRDEGVEVGRGSPPGPESTARRPVPPPPGRCVTFSGSRDRRWRSGGRPVTRPGARAARPEWTGRGRTAAPAGGPGRAPGRRPSSASGRG